MREKHSDGINGFFPSFGHLRISDGFVLLHKKGAFGVQCSLNNGDLLILSRRGGRNFQKWNRFQPIRRTLFFHVYYYRQIESEISD